MLEALAANIDYNRYLLEGNRLTLAGNIVTAAITQASTASNEISRWAARSSSNTCDWSGSAVEGAR